MRESATGDSAIGRDSSAGCETVEVVLAGRHWDTGVESQLGGNEPILYVSALIARSIAQVSGHVQPLLPVLIPQRRHAGTASRTGVHAIPEQGE